MLIVIALRLQTRRVVLGDIAAVLRSVEGHFFQIRVGGGPRPAYIIAEPHHRQHPPAVGNQLVVV
jgi:hypothetical protein